MRLSRALIGLLAAALLGLVPIALTSSSAHAAVATTISASTPKSAYLYGNVITVSGRVTQSATGAAMPNDPEGTVFLLRAMRTVDGPGEYRIIDQWADESLAFTFRTKAIGNAYYAVAYYDSNDTYGYSEQVKYLKVGRHPHASAYKYNGYPWIKGNVDPGWGDKPVDILKRNCSTCSWFVWKRVRTSSTGAFRVRVAYPGTVGGEWHWRVRVPGTAPRWSPGYSKVWKTYKTYGRTALR